MNRNKKLVIIGMGYLMEYLYPCYAALLGEDIKTHIAAVTADEKDLARKREKFDFPIILGDNWGTLMEHRPDIILFAPPPKMASGLAEEVLIPYYHHVRSEGLTLPILYAFPPNPTGAYYQEKLGEDILVVNILPNMVSEIAGEKLAGEGLTYLTYPDHSSWSDEEKGFAVQFFKPLGGCIEVKPAHVMQMLAGTVTVHNISEIIFTMTDALVQSGNLADFHHIAGAMRAYHEEKWGYVPENSEPCSSGEVELSLYQALKKVTYHWFRGIYMFYMDTGMDTETSDRILVSLLDLHLHLHQKESRETIEKNGAQHATKGGVLEKGCQVYTRQVKAALFHAFIQWPDTLLTDSWCSWLEQQAYSITAQVSGHSRNLAVDGGTQFLVEHHAAMFGLLAKSILDICGESGTDIVKAGTQRYAYGRGYRMRQRCQNHGQPTDMLHYMAYGEWRPEPGSMEIQTRQKSPVNKTLVTLCPWMNAWKKYGLSDYAKHYCDYADFALVKGFDPELELEMDSCMARGGKGCGFIWNGADLTSEQESQLTQVKANNGDSTIMSWEYHTAHLFYAFKEVLEDNLDRESSREVLDSAIRDYIEIYGESVMEILRAYQNTDFLMLTT